MTSAGKVTALSHCAPAYSTRQCGGDRCDGRLTGGRPGHGGTDPVPRARPWRNPAASAHAHRARRWHVAAGLPGGGGGRNVATTASADPDRPGRSRGRRHGHPHRQRLRRARLRPRRRRHALRRRHPVRPRPRRPFRRRRRHARADRRDLRRAGRGRHRPVVPAVRPAWKGAASRDLPRQGRASAPPPAASPSPTSTAPWSARRRRSGRTPRRCAPTLARIAGIEADRISVKATTSERLGFTGRGEGIAALATATLVRP